MNGLRAFRESLHGCFTRRADALFDAVLAAPTLVLKSFAALLPLVGTLASAPKPCGRSPGRPRDSRSGPAKRYPAAKKAAQGPRMRTPPLAEGSGAFVV